MSTPTLDELIRGLEYSDNPKTRNSECVAVIAALRRLQRLELALREADAIAIRCRHEAQFFDHDAREVMDHAASLLERLAALSGKEGDGV